MILRLVLSFCFLCFVTGNSWTRKYTNAPQSPPVEGDENELPCTDGEDNSESLDAHGQYLRSGGDEFADNLPYTRVTPGDEAPFEQDLFSTDAENIARSKHFKRDMDIITSESKTKVVKIPDALLENGAFHSFTRNKKDCYSSINVKKIMIGILEHVKQNPYELDMLIQEIRSEIDAESQVVWYKNNMQADAMKSSFMQYGSSKFETYPQCSGAFTKLAEKAFNAYSELENFPLCLQVMFGYKGTTQQIQKEESNVDIDLIVSTILKQMEKYMSTKLQTKPRPKPQKIEMDIPDIDVQQFHIVKPSVVTQQIAEPVIMDDVYVQSDMSDDVYMPEYQSVSEIISMTEPEPEQEPPYMPSGYAPQEGPTLPEYMPEPQPEPEYMEAPEPEFMYQPQQKPIMQRPEQPDYVTVPEMYQEPEVYPVQEIYEEPEVYHLSEVVQSKPQYYQQQQTEVYAMPEIYEPEPEGYPEVYYEQNDQVYVEPTQEIYIEPQNQQIYYDTKDFYVEPKPFYVNPKPAYVEPSPVYINPKPVIIEPNPIYVEPTPYYVESTPEIYPEDYVTSTTSKSKVVNILLRLVTDKYSTNTIENIITILKKNRSVFKPRLYKILSALVNGYRKGIFDTYTFNEMFYFILQPQQNTIWNDEKKQFLWYLLLPDKEGQVDMTKLDDILSFIHTQDAYSIHILDEIFPLFKQIKEGRADQRTIEILLTLLSQNKYKILRPDQINVLLTLIKPNKKGRILSKYIDIAAPLVHWDQISYLKPEYVNIIFSLLRPNVNGKLDSRATEVIHEILSPKKTKYLTKKDINTIFTFLKSDTGKIETRRLDIVSFILKNMPRAPRLIDVLIKLLKDTDIVNSKYIDILLSLQKRQILSIPLLEGLISLLKQERNGNVDQHVVNNVLLSLEPYKTTHPKIVIDIYNQLRPVPANINFNVNTIPDNIRALLYKLLNAGIQVGDLQMPGYEPLQYLYNGYNTAGADKQSMKLNLLAKILQMLQWEQKREFATESLANNYGFIELTYMLKHQKPLLYHPVYYVKYRIPMVSFLTNAKSLISQRPQLTSDPARLLQELIIEGNVSEVSPNLKGYRKEDILKLTFKDGDLVQAKVLDEKSMNLNEQIKLMHNLNSDVSPEDILQQNKMNAAKYYSPVGSSPMSNLGNMGGGANFGGMANLGGMGNLGGLASLGGAASIGGSANYGMSNAADMAAYGTSNINVANYGATSSGHVSGYGSMSMNTLSTDYSDNLGYYNKRRDFIPQFKRSSEQETEDTRQVQNSTSEN